MRLIDADTLLRKTVTYIDGSRYISVQRVDEVPTVDAVLEVHGRWIEREDFNFDKYYDCSACGESFCFIEGEPDDNFYRYCPNCGSKMDGERITNEAD